MRAGDLFAMFPSLHDSCPTGYIDLVLQSAEEDGTLPALVDRLRVVDRLYSRLGWMDRVVRLLDDGDGGFRFSAYGFNVNERADGSFLATGTLRKQGSDWTFALEA